MDVTIVGAGPVGCFLARKLRDLELQIFEEHETIGEPVQCTGLISRNVDKLFKVPENCILNSVKGTKMYSPSGKVLELARGSDQAYVIDRALFDKELANGLDIKFGQKINSLNFDSKFVIGADGPNSTIAKLAGFPELGEVLLGVQYEIENTGYETEFVEMYFGNKKAPGFFAWIVPTHENLRIGLAASSNQKEYLDKFFNSKFKGAKILDKHAGLIPVRYRDLIVKENIALVGDAAGHVKPTTGGGIYMGMSSARLLGKAIKAGNLESYVSDWNKEIKPELDYGFKIREFLKRMDDEQLDKIWDILNNETVKQFILKHGDMDKPSKLLKGVIKDPKILAYLPYLRFLLS